MSDKTVREDRQLRRRQIAEWFQNLQYKPGDRAALRRARDPDEALSIRTCAFLYFNLAKHGVSGDAAARIAMALAVIKEGGSERPDDREEADHTEDDQGVAGSAEKDAASDRDGDGRDRTGEALGKAFAARYNSKPRLSEDRLRLLTSADDPDAFLRLLRSALNLLNGKAAIPIIDVAETVRLWHFPKARSHVRRRLFLAYFQSTLGNDPETENA